MKTLLRNIIFYAIALYIVPSVVQGVKIYGGLPTLLIGGFALTLLFMTVKPILTLVSLPLTIATMGLFSIVTNTIILYLLTVFVTRIVITPFVFSGARIIGFVIPQIAFNGFFAHVAAAFVLSTIISLVMWLIE